VVLTALCDYHLQLKRTKCSFVTSSVAYLGHVISDEGITMDHEKNEAVTSWPQPRSMCGLCSFVRLAGYYLVHLGLRHDCNAPHPAAQEGGLFLDSRGNHGL
jgi:hypothetical protein